MSKFLAGFSYDKFGMRFAMPLCDVSAIPATLFLSVAELFGTRAFFHTVGIFAAVNTACYAVGAPLMNWCYDAFGTYVPFIWVRVGIMAVVTVMYQLVISAAARERKKILAAENI